LYNIINKIFLDNYYDSNSVIDDVMFHEKVEKEYYFTAKYGQDEFFNFFEADKTNDIIQQFDSYKKDDDNIKKNTSLIIYVEVENLEEFQSVNKSMIFKVEEDEYFFKKYVIIYTKSSIKNINLEKNINNQLNEILQTDDMIDKYQGNNYFDDEYLVAMQLIIKIPFLSLEIPNKRFKPVEQKINDSLQNDSLYENNQILLNLINKIEETHEDQENSNDYYKNLKESFLSTNDDNETLTYFFNELGVQLNED